MYVNVTSERRERDVEYYWIIQRRYLVEEDEELCPEDSRDRRRRDRRRENDYCYTSTRSKEIRGYNGIFEIGLEFEELTEEDIEEPIYLVKERKYPVR